MKYKSVNVVSRLGYKFEVLYLYVEKSWPLSNNVDTRNLAQLKNTPWCVNEGKTLKIFTEG